MDTEEQNRLVEKRQAVIESSEQSSPTLPRNLSRLLTEPQISRARKLIFRKRELGVGVAFGDVVVSIEQYLLSLKTPKIQIPYSTHIWVAQLH
jgi:hypothetical protein